MYSQFEPERMLVVYFPTWSVSCLGYTPNDTAATVGCGIIHSPTLSAIKNGVKPGAKVRAAHGVCPELITTERDTQRELRAFLYITDVLSQVAPRLALQEPGICLIPLLGPTRYFGGEDAFVQHVTLLIQEALRDLSIDASFGIGVADGVFAATLAAQQQHSPCVIKEGETVEFLGKQSVRVLRKFPCVDVLHKMGIHTLQEFALLNELDVLGRFGNEGTFAQHLARGFDLAPLVNQQPPPTFSVETTHDPPLAYVEQVAFVARNIAHQICERLSTEGLACMRLHITAQTATGNEHSQTWSHEGVLQEAHIIERVRWQLDAWLTHKEDDEYTVGDISSLDGIAFLRVQPDGLLPNNGVQLGFWGEHAPIEARVTKAVAHVNTLLEDDVVQCADIQGGRLLANRVQFRRWIEETKTPNPTFLSLISAGDKNAPQWPGRLPPPYPATVFPDALPADVRNKNGALVGVSLDGAVRSEPARLRIEHQPWQHITHWSGPWLVDERWWDPKTHRRCARFQILTKEGNAYLVALENRQWWIHAVYD